METDETVRAAIQDALEWPTSSLPFPTHKNDWALWVHPESGRWMYIEHSLIRAVHQAADSETYHETFMGIGHKMLKWWRSNSPVPCRIYVCTFANLPGIQVRFGLFDGRFFAFSPRPDLEREWPETTTHDGS